jgi:thymidine kinase
LILGNRSGLIIRLRYYRGMDTSTRRGRLEVICGCMFSGKSEELIRRLIRADIARQRVVAIKPAIDTRYSEDKIASHAGRVWPSALAATAQEVADIADEHRPHVLGIEEAQFFDDELIAVVRRLVGYGVRVICAGLDLDAMERPFGPMPDLICVAESVDKIAAVCMVCGADAHRSQLLVDGRPAQYNEYAVINVGGAERYEARCRQCFVLPGRPS